MCSGLAVRAAASATFDGQRNLSPRHTVAFRNVLPNRVGTAEILSSPLSARDVADETSTGGCRELIETP